MLSPQPASGIQSLELPRSRGDFTAYFTPVIDSTMNLRPWCESHGIPIVPGLVVAAEQQTHGVGQHGAWLSASGDIKLSVVLECPSDIRGHELLNCAAAMSVWRTLRELVLESAASSAMPVFGVKLANDVLARDPDGYKKVSGSLAVGRHHPEMKDLLEKRDGFIFPDASLVVLGIGVNLRRFERALNDPLFPPTSLEDLCNRVVDYHLAVDILLRNLKSQLFLAQTYPEMFCRELFEALALAEDRRGRVVNRNGNQLDGEILSVLPDGVRVHTASGIHQIPLEQIQRLIPSKQTA